MIMVDIYRVSFILVWPDVVAVRFYLVDVCGRLVERAGGSCINLSSGCRRNGVALNAVHF